MNKTILVTGANRGIGLELVKQYAKTPCKIIACCRDPHRAAALQQLSHANHNIIIYPLDISSENSIQNLAEKLKEEHIDILFNNAGIAGKDDELGHITQENLLYTVQVNTVGPILLMQALLKQITTSNIKMIVNTSSLLSSIELNQDDSWFWLAYRISKSGLNAATRSIANKLKSHQITVIGLDPGWVQTDMGGANAPLTTEDSVRGIMKMIENVSLNDTGNLINYQGDYVPW